ncbi:hypothetical protein BKP35_06650 [Anaerobacillus arseniciselenatis]|uniref:DUF2283 domain-containing protein n=1 Tax=Anaerobacillus arseniciselenatis TaxID=85682 RepID=A0A1S2LPZ3_9BACI|nr:DUF2283 domain-containing protein [Anaerobacillus arseniciselenatis]OIJ14551.1 hypothetical protein BKP35_06650 [Anaerobacillus arseniciselenatis]
MADINFEQITYDVEDEIGYIYLTEPEKFDYYTEQLPENEEIILDLGKEVPVVGVELGGDSAKKIATLSDEQKRFVKKTDDYGHNYFSFRLEDKPVKQSISYERIIEVKFLFADDECEDFIGIEVYSNDPNYTFLGCERDEGGKSKGIFRKIKERFGK